MIKSDVGGVIEISEKEGEAFTGGSNLEVSPNFPQHNLQRQPLKLGNLKLFHEGVNKGIPCKLAAPNAKQQDVTLVFWSKQLRQGVIELGLIAESLQREEGCW